MDGNNADEYPLRLISISPFVALKLHENCIQSTHKNAEFNHFAIFWKYSVVIPSMIRESRGDYYAFKYQFDSSTKLVS